jgi:hypothetical protein
MNGLAQREFDNDYRVIGVTEKPDPAAIAAAVRAFVALRLLRRATALGVKPSDLMDSESNA